MKRKETWLLVTLSFIMTLIIFRYISKNQTNESKSISDVSAENKSVSKIHRDVASSPPNDLLASEQYAPEAVELKKTASEGENSEDMQQFLQRKKMAQAMAQKWQAVLDNNPESTEALGNIGYALLGSGDKEEAIRLAEKCLELDNKNELCHTVRYFAASYLDNTIAKSDLLPHLDECLSAIPGHYLCLSEMIQHQLIANQIDKAEEYLVRMEKLHPDKPHTLYERAMYFLALKDYDRTRQYLKAACDKEKSDSFITMDYSLKDTACLQLKGLKNYH